MEIFGTCVQGEGGTLATVRQNNPFPCHHLAREKFTWSAAARTLCCAWQCRLSSAPCSEHGAPAWGHQQHPERGMDVAGGYHTDITFGLCTESGQGAVRAPSALLVL